MESEMYEGKGSSFTHESAPPLLSNPSFPPGHSSLLPPPPFIISSHSWALCTGAAVTETCKNTSVHVFVCVSMWGVKSWGLLLFTSCYQWIPLISCSSLLSRPHQPDESSRLITLLDTSGLALTADAAFTREGDYVALSTRPCQLCRRWNRDTEGESSHIFEPQLVTAGESRISECTKQSKGILHFWVLFLVSEYYNMFLHRFVHVNCQSFTGFAFKTWGVTLVLYVTFCTFSIIILCLFFFSVNLKEMIGGRIQTSVDDK